MTTDIDRGASRSLKSTVEFNVLGPVTVADGTETLNIGGPKQRTVLSMLIAHYGRSVSNDVLAEAVYGDDATPRNRRNVQTYVSTLRSVLGDVIKKQGKGWYLDVDRSSIDALAFEDLYELARQSPDAAGRILREALAMWRGHPYYDIEAHGRLDPEITRLIEQRIAAQAARIDADLEAGRHADLIGEIQGLLAEHPYTERFRAQHMVALYRAGRQREALRSYETMRSLLLDELGVDPTPELQDLEQRILDQDESLNAKPQRQIQTKAIVVADPGDPMDLARLPSGKRDQLLSESSEAIRQVASASEGSLLFPAGTATYAVFNDIGEAARSAEQISRRLNDRGLRIAVDFGDIEVTDGGVGGAPVSRASVLVSVAHQGQVLLSSEAQRQLVSDDEGTGLRFESLGRHELIGIETPTSVYQLLVGDPPKTFPPLETDRLPAPLPTGGDRSVAGYELREPIGAGSIGTLYRAYQPSVGREVMVEVIGRSEASDADFIRRFEADAQRLSLLEHPNIADLLDYWRDPEGAYLVYRFYRGGTLDMELAGDANRIVEQIGSALQYAHSYGLVHGSLRPDRVMLDESGNPYLLGFPIAGVPGHSSTEHPAYIAPETLRGNAPTPETDIYALGVLAHEMTSGRVESDEAVVASDSVLARALDEDPDRRYQSIAEFLSELAPRDPDAPDTRFTETRNPYKGLAAFHESDVRDFFGRLDLTDQLIERLAVQDFLAVVGPSGSGKSSVVRAGLIPAVRQGRIPGSDSWLVTDMLPGSHPFLELRRALERVAVDMPAGVMDALASEHPDALADVGSVLPAGASLLLLVDQFEELFTLVSEETRSRFIDLLATAVSEGHARAVVTLRADFLDRPLAYSELADLFDRRVVTVGSPTEAELREAITKPAAAVGVEIAPEVVERMANEVQDRPGALPLLQHTLAELFAGRDTDLISLDGYEALGGVSGSLGNRAETVYQGLESDDQPATKQLFLRLVTITDESAPTRRRVRVTSLDDLAASSALTTFSAARLLVLDSDPDTRTPTVEVAHEALLTHWPRLNGWIESAREDLTLARRLEEAMREWQRNGHDDAYLLTGARLAQHKTWTTSSSLKLTEDESRYLDLSAHRDEKQRAQSRRRRNWTTAGFAAAAVVASIFGIVALNEAERADDAATQAAANEDLANEQADLAQSAAEKAREAADLAKARELAASSINVKDADPELATLLAVEALNTAPLGSGVFSEGLIALREAIDGNRLIGRLPAVASRGVAFAADDSLLLVTDAAERSVSAYPITNGSVGVDPVWVYQDLTTIDHYMRTYVNPKADVAAVTIIDGSFGGEPGELVELDDDGHDTFEGRVLLLDVTTGERLGDVQLEACEQASDFPYWFSADGSIFGMALEATACAPDTDWFGWVLFETDTWTETHRFDHAMVTMTADNSLVLIDGLPGPGELRTFPELELIRSFDFEKGRGLRMISPDGRTIVARYGNEIDLRPGFWDVETGQFLAYGDSFDGFFIPPPTFTPGGLMFAASTESDVLFDPRSGARILSLPSGFTDQIAVSSSGVMAASATSDDGVLLWSLGPRESGRSVTGSAAEFSWFNPDSILEGPTDAVWGFPDCGEFFCFRAVATLDFESGEVIAVRDALDWSQLPDGRIALLPMEVGEDDASWQEATLGPLTIWDPATDDEQVVQACQVLLGEFASSDDEEFGLWRGAECDSGDFFFGHSLAASSDGRYLASVSHDPDIPLPPGNEFPRDLVLRTWDLSSLQILNTFALQVDETVDAGALRHFGDGWLLLIDGVPGRNIPFKYRVIDPESGETMAELRVGDGWRESVEVSDDGSLLYLVSEGGTVFEYETESWEVVRSWQAMDGRPRGLALSPDSSKLAVSGEDEQIVIWDLEPSEQVRLDRIPVGAWASDITWIDGARMGAAVLNPRAQTTEWRIIDLDPSVVASKAQQSLIRDFTPEECRTYGIERCTPDE